MHALFSHSIYWIDKITILDSWLMVSFSNKYLLSNKNVRETVAVPKIESGAELYNFFSPFNCNCACI